MIRELKFVIYSLIVFFSFFFVIKHYFSEDNIKQTKIVINQHQKQLDKKFSNLPVIKNDTINIIEYTNEIDKFKNKRERNFWDLFKIK